MLNRAQGTLPIGRTNINTTSPTLNGYVGNSGNLPFTLGTPAYVATGNTTVFSVMSPSSNGCSNGQVIAVGTENTHVPQLSPECRAVIDPPHAKRKRRQQRS